MKPIPAVIYFLLIFSTAFVSCRKESTTTPYTQMQKEKMENELKGIKLIDEQKNRIRQYELDDNKLGLMLCYRYLGLAYRDSGEFDSALEAHRKEYKLAGEHRDSVEMIIALNNIGTNFRRIGALAEASTYHYRALMISNQYSDHTSFLARKNRAISLNGVRNVHLTLGNLELSDSVFRLALKEEEILGSKIGQAINYANLGALLDQENKTDSAYLYYKKSMELNREAGSDLGVALCQLALGGLEEKDKAWNQALRQYEHAYHLLKKIKDHWHWMDAAFSFIKIYISMGDYDMAEHYIAETKPVAERLGSLEHLAKLYHEESLVST